VWHAAVDIADGAPGDSPDDMVSLLRIAAFDPSVADSAVRTWPESSLPKSLAT
jgi:hypothetical protein